MFASKSGGYWRSEDLAKWEYIPCTTIPTMEDYAPTILVYGDTLYFTASSGNTRIYKNAHPEKDTWEEVDTKFGVSLNMIRRSLKMMMKSVFLLGMFGCGSDHGSGSGSQRWLPSYWRA